MTFQEKRSLFLRMNDLIRRKSTGAPDEFAERLKMSRASLFRRLDDLKSMGAPINYDKNRECYYYEEPFDLNL